MATVGGRPHELEPIIAIQVLRALAAIAVIFTHFQFDLGRMLNAGNALPNLSLGAAGVDLFFVISGFVMVYASGPMFGRPGGPTRFLTRRLIRIVPLYWLATTLYLVLAFAIPAFEKSYSLVSVIGSYLFIPLPRLDGVMQPVVGQGWTLNYEMFFYAVFAATVFAPRRIAVALASAVLITAVVAGKLLAPTSPTLAFWLDPIVLEFVFGMAIGLAYREGVRLPQPVAILAILAGFLLFLVMPRYIDSRLISLGLPAAIVVAGAAFGEFSLRSAAWGPLATVGDASYAVYLFHLFPVRAVLMLGAAAGFDIAGNPWPYLAAAVIGAIALGLVIYYLFERPVTGALRRQLLPASTLKPAEKPESTPLLAGNVNTLGVK
jgi:peptidoglycan/LPS O-acetylase OafA/YrhL